MKTLDPLALADSLLTLANEAEAEGRDPMPYLFRALVIVQLGQLAFTIQQQRQHVVRAPGNLKLT